ncbi:MAG: PD-(D/E)XK nuclease family protein [Candidatus Hydrogenedentota bacterium]
MSESKFLQKLVKELIDRKDIKIADLIIVLPTHRSLLFFKKYLQKDNLLKKPLWSPRLYSLPDFIKKLSNLIFPSQISLLFKLFKVYKTLYPEDEPKEFDEFYFWGDMLLSDFNEIDMYLLNPEGIFRNLNELTQIDTYFENKDEISDIRENLTQKDIYKRYKYFSTRMENLYDNFTNLLREKREAYYGLALRQIIENPPPQPFWPANKKIIFAGFNALTTAEEKIINTFIKNHNAEIYWDMDKYFVDDFLHEAGYFFRKMMSATGRDIARWCWIDDILTETKKNIRIIGSAGDISQAKIAGSIIKGFIEEIDADTTDTVLVLSDETLLFPLLNSLPPEIKKINVSMGYPLKSTPIYALISSIIKMYENEKQLSSLSSETSTTLYYKDVIEILMHPYINLLLKDKSIQLINEIKNKNISFVKEDFISTKDEVFNIIFKKPESVDNFIENIYNLLIQIRSEISKDKEKDWRIIEYEYLYQFFIIIQQIQDEIKECDIKIDVFTFWRLLKRIISDTRIPFTGEPLEGLQIMGFLETRALDFKNVFILSVNDGILPAGKHDKTFIPYEIRNHIGLPTPGLRDAVYSYNFYRLIKRAENIYLFYNTESDELGKSGKSRYIEQLIYEYSEKNPNLTIKEEIITLPVKSETPKPIIIKKDSGLIERLTNLSYSATSLLTYINCPLSFYFKYILQIKEKEEIIESADSSVFGIIIHRILYQIYSNFIDKIINKNKLSEIKKTLAESVITEYKNHIPNIETGKNQINIEIVTRIIERTISYESKQNNIKIIALEKKYDDTTKVGFDFAIAGKKYSIILKGIIDRIDKEDDVYRIIDYKTGATGDAVFNMDSIPDNETLIERLQKKNDVLQLLFYFYLYLATENLSKNDRFKLGIYPIRKIVDGINFLRKPHQEPYLLGLNDLEKIKKLIGMIFTDIFDINKPFIQIEDADTCKYCHYKDICCK